MGRRHRPYAPTLAIVFLACAALCACSPLSITSQPSESRIAASWLWGLMWGGDSTVTVVDRSPPLSFDARPAAFGPPIDVLGYLIRVEDFSVPCDERAGVAVTRGSFSNASDVWGEGRGDARHGCPELCARGPHRPEASETWIALVMRGGGCTFVDKVREAQRFGAKGVVIGGESAEQDRHGDGLVQMYSMADASDIMIPSTYVTHASYLNFSSLVAHSSTSTWGLRTISIAVTSDFSGWEWYSPLLTFSILLLLPSSLTLITLLVHRIRAARAAQRERAPEDIVHNLPWRVWQSRLTLWELEKALKLPQGSALGTREDSAESQGGEGEPHDDDKKAARDGPARDSSAGEASVPPPPQRRKRARQWYETQVECAICLDEFAAGDRVRVLPCRHIFHMDEVDTWLIEKKRLCPTCKYDVTCPPFSPGPQSSRPPSSFPSSPEGGDAENEIELEPSSERQPQSEAAPATERTPLLRSAEE